MLTDLNSLGAKMREIALGHARKGVMAYEYGIVGEVLMWTFQKCFGDEFDELLRLAWLKLYSIMITEILPIALREELLFHSQKKNAVRYAPAEASNTNSVPTITATNLREVYS